MAGSEAPRFALRCSGLFLVRRFRACRTRQQTFSASAWRRLGDEDVSEFGTNEQRSLLFESATFCLCVCKCMLTDACLYAYVVWVCLCCVASICRVLACVRVDSYVCVSTSILIRGLPHPQRLLKSPWPGGDPHPIQNFKMKIFRFKFRGCCLN